MSGTPEHRGSPGGPTKGPRGAVMKKRILVAGAVVVLVAAGCAVAATRSGLWPGGAIAQAPRQNAPRAVPVEIVTAVKKVVPVRIEVLGTVTLIASVGVKPRVDSEITPVHFRDGAQVKKRDHAGHAAKRANAGQYLALLGRFQHGATRKSQRPAQLLHHPGAD